MIGGPTAVAALVPIPPPVVDDPVPTPRYGPGIPYISGRLGGVQQAPTDAPIGNVVPDDFCLPGKFEDCGDHLRDQPDSANATNNGPVFVDMEDTAFGEARHSGWINGQSRQTDDTAASEQTSALAFSIGGDRKISERLILGAMIVSTDTTLDFNLTGIEDQAKGFLVGPYFAFQLSEDWVLDGRFLMGNSDHSVLTAGIQTGNFQSTESFAALRVSRTFNTNKWRLHPSLEIASLTQNDDAYTDTLRGAIATNDTTDTFITGAVLAYYNGLGALNPYIGLEATQSVGNGSDFFGTFRTGIATTFGNGAILNIDYAYGAIGLANVDDQLVSIRLEIPF
ncbi:MAG: hypothetical protein COB40_02955 [Marinosulfonomonas sp.]|nr:MAG: hypothetical protein COB40_02955 [Marinosulfonomonas sp.]